MATYGYLRVSTNQQDVDHQRLQICEYTNQKSLDPLDFVEDNVFREKWPESELGILLTEKVKEGDVVVFAEICHISHSTQQVLEVLKQFMQKKVVVHIVKEQKCLTDSMFNQINNTVISLIADIEKAIKECNEKQYDPDVLKQLWDDGYDELVKYPGKPGGRLREARFVMQAKVAHETSELGKRTLELEKSIKVATWVIAIFTVIIAIPPVYEVYKDLTAPKSNLEKQDKQP